MRALFRAHAPGLRACLALASCAPLAAQGGDNVLLIVADDLGVDKVGVYREGPNPPPTPNVDALAGRGVLFRNAWSNAVCSPTRACIMTGRYSLRTHVGNAIPIGGTGALRAAEVTLPEALDAARSGYAHAAIGKWHLGPVVGASDHPRDVGGWSHFAGLLAGAVTSYERWPRTVNGVTATSRTYATTAMVDDALTWIGRQREGWVCYLAFNAVHTPLHAPPAHLHGQDLRGKTPRTHPVAFHTAMVEAMDREIGRLLRGLGARLARTNVVFIGDNGTSPLASQSPFEPDHAKATPYEGGVNVPLIVAGPAVRAPGREVGALVGAVDLYATVLELAGVDVRRAVPPWIELDSVSIGPYLRDPGRVPLRDTVLAEMFNGDSHDDVDRSGFAALRNARYKLIRRFHALRRPTDELYDLRADPFEERDLTDTRLTAEQRRNYLALAAELSRLRSPRGRIATFGAVDCIGSNGRPEVAGDGVPTVGRSYRVRLLRGAAARPATLLAGASHERWGPLSLPADLGPLGAPGCRLYCSGEIRLGALTDASGEAGRIIAVPASPALVGRTLFHTWLVHDPRAPGNTLGVTTSNALAAVIGA